MCSLRPTENKFWGCPRIGRQHKAKNWGCPDTVDTNGLTPLLCSSQRPINSNLNSQHVADDEYL